MALRIEIDKMYNGKLEIRTGDLSGSSTSSNFTKEEILSEISDEIDTMVKNPNKIINPSMIHYRIQDSYLCNKTCYIKESKCTKNTEQVTCKNCLRKIEKGEHNLENDWRNTNWSWNGHDQRYGIG